MYIFRFKKIFIFCFITLNNNSELVFSTPVWYPFRDYSVYCGSSFLIRNQIEVREMSYFTSRDKKIKDNSIWNNLLLIVNAERDSIIKDIIIKNENSKENHYEIIRGTKRAFNKHLLNSKNRIEDKVISQQDIILFDFGYSIYIDSFLFNQIFLNLNIGLIGIGKLGCINFGIEAIKKISFIFNKFDFILGLYLFDITRRDEEIYNFILGDLANFKICSGFSFRNYISVKYFFQFYVSEIAICLIGLVISTFIYFIINYLTNKLTSYTLSPVKKSHIKFKDIGGHKIAKKELQEIVNFIKNKKNFTKKGAKLPRGIILYGPPGTGKTMLGKAIGGEAECAFLYVSASDICDVDNLFRLFERAKTADKCVLFIDEIEVLGSRKDPNNRYTNIITKLLTIIDGVDSLKNVFILAATNNIDKTDPALLREGRIGKKIYVGNPEYEERIEIIEIKLKNKNIDPNLDIKKMAKLLQEFSGADIEGILNQSMINAINENRKMIQYQDFEKALDKKLLGEKNLSIIYSDEEKKIIAEREAAKILVYYYLCNEIFTIYKSTIALHEDKIGQTSYVQNENKKFLTLQDNLNLLKGLLSVVVTEKAFKQKPNDILKISNESEEIKKLANKIISQNTLYANPYINQINKEINNLIKKTYLEVLLFLKKHNKQHKLLTNILLQKETISLEDIELILNE